jgi:hypothetical protein
LGNDGLETDTDDGRGEWAMRILCCASNRKQTRNSEFWANLCLFPISWNRTR